jgi:hypothetical protein
MNTTNTEFRFAERAPYELAYLLRELPRHFRGADLSSRQLLEIEAADHHAANHSDSLIRGLQGLGRLIASTGLNEEMAPDVSDFADVGSLVTEIALQLQFLNEFRQSIAEHNLRRACALTPGEAGVCEPGNTGVHHG